MVSFSMTFDELENSPSLEMTHHEKTTALFNDTKESLEAIADTQGGAVDTIAIARQ